jgi:hypothetical protein
VIGLALMAMRTAARELTTHGEWCIGTPWPRKACEPVINSMSLRYYELIDAATAAGIRMGPEPIHVFVTFIGDGP